MRSYENDESGTEFAVETGFGVITKVEWPLEGKKNANVIFDVEGLKIPVKGWANTADREDIRQAIADAFDRRSRVAFRIEIHRAAEQDKEKPFCDVPDFSRFRRLEGLRVAGGTVVEPAAAPSPPVAKDGWSYAVGMVDLSYELLHGAAQDGPSQDGRLKTVLPSQVRALAAVLLQVADTAQATALGVTDREANSHTRARGAVRTALRFLPPPLGEVGKLGAWVERLERISSVLLTQASELAIETPATADAVAVLEASWTIPSQNSEN